MAFQQSQSPVAQFPRKGMSTNRRQAAGFLNFYVPTRNGRRKVGYIPLYDDRSFDAAIIERLKAGGEEALEALKDVVQIEFNTSEADEDNLPQF